MVIRALVLAVGLMFSAKAAATVANDTRCLAQAAFSEAKGEGEYAMALVIHAVLNRVDHRGLTPCQVIYQPHQFTNIRVWDRKDPAHFAPMWWSEALRTATMVLANQVQFGACSGATHFYAPKVVKRKPAWASRMTFKCEYGGHRFYAAK